MTEPDYLTVDEVADALGLKPSTIRAYLARKQMPEPDRRFGHVAVWRFDTIRAWRPVEGYPAPLRVVPARPRVEHPAHGRPLPDPLNRARAEGWQACIEWLAERMGPTGVLVDAENSNPWDLW